MPGHTDRFIHLDCLAEERPRLVVVAGRVPVDQHLRVPAADFGLRDLVGQLVRLPEGRLEVLLRGSDAAAVLEALIANSLEQIETYLSELVEAARNR